MKQTIRKIVPVHMFDLPEMETWLSYLAAKGLWLKKIDSVFAVFEKKEPASVSYRMEPMTERIGPPDASQIALYEDFGWHYVCSASYFHFFCTTEEHPTELHSDPYMQSCAFSYLRKKMKMLRFAAVFIFLCLAMMLYSVLGHPAPMYYLVTHGQPSLILLSALLSVSALFQSYSCRKKLEKLAHSLSEGNPMRHHKSYRANYFFPISYSVILVCSLLLCTHSFWSLLSKKESYPLAEYTAALPTIRLEEIEQARSDVPLPDNMETEGMYESHRTDLASSIVSIDETLYLGHETGELWKDQSGFYRPSLTSTFYTLRFGFLANALVDSLIQKDTELSVYEAVTYQELFDTDFDRAVLVTEAEKQCFYAVKDNRVLALRYYGYGNLSAFTEELYQAVTAYST